MSHGDVGDGHKQTCVKDTEEIWQAGLEAIGSDDS
jgi:hypothetical protein